jgi:hypothetical protein
MSKPTNQPADKQTSQRTSFFLDLAAVATLWALVLAFFWRIALAGRVLAGGDVFTYFYPYWAEATRAVQAGRLPLWNPYLFMGAPFLANSQVGVFYPLNWPLWLLLPAHQSVHLTLVLHLCLAALSAYAWSRISLRMGRVGAWIVGATFALGGYLGAQVEHVNQLQGLAWLPLLLLLYDQSLVSGLQSSRYRVADLACWGIRATAFVGLAVVIALVLLAGHTQTAFISLVGLAVYGVGPALWRAMRRREWRPLVRCSLLLAIAAGLGIMLAAVQLAPTFELMPLSVRAGGLPFKERVSFSLTPYYLTRAFLPGYGDPVIPEHIEHVAYVGVAGLVLAAVASCFTQNVSHTSQSPLSSFHSSRHQPVVWLLALGLFFSLGAYNPLYWPLARYVPGFAHFRVPGRWLALYALGAAALAGWGIETLWNRRVQLRRRRVLLATAVFVLAAGWAVVGVRIGEGGSTAWVTVIGWAVAGILSMVLIWAAGRAPRLAVLGLVVLLLAELFGATSTLPHSRATAYQAFTSLRPAVAHMLASDSSAGSPRSRFLSMSDITFDPGDLGEIEVIYGPQLSERALYDYTIAAKHKEVLSPNMPLAFAIPALDGYDGGVLPLARYVTLQRLFLQVDEVSIDGRLRENVATVPDGRWLSLFNVRYVITDKLHDAWLDDVFYDLQFGAHLGDGDMASVAHVPRLKATALGFVSSLSDTDLAAGETAGLVEVTFEDGSAQTFELRSGEHTREGSDGVTRLRWEEPAVPASISVRATLSAGELVVRGLSLVDERTGSFQALALSDRGRFRLVHSGDVKIYENLDVLPRAFLVHEAVVVADDDEALALMQLDSFDPGARVVLAEGESVDVESSVSSVRATHYAHERIEIEVESDAPGYLILTDAWYPGWEATVDGQPVPIYRSDLYFRAVPVEAGHHRVIFAFRPASVRVGMIVSLVGLLCLILLVVGVARLSRCSRSSHP